MGRSNPTREGVGGLLERNGVQGSVFRMKRALEIVQGGESAGRGKGGQPRGEGTQKWVLELGRAEGREPDGESGLNLT